ncbi:hypothetical protein GOBAR_AA23615 [Gossypium barbadense]|uniref:Pentacotripeptide-repeat region of PRORP domain-containing protein n=1 Tax=Gossypium barbadense TaxID=3634 RepID=A0A2P5X116_GOSBA|nr:hypothetical protein GOBAR_AA23615 [Gossypium barbadense]
MALPSTRAIANSAQVLDLIPIVNSITSLLQTLNPRNPIPINLTSSPLSRFSPFLDPNLVTLVIHKQTNPYHALFFFNWASNPNPNPYNYSHNHTCYEAITDLLLRHSLFHPTVKLLEKSQKLSDFFVGKIIKAYGDRVKANLIDLVETLFDNVVKEGVVQPDVSSYTILMRVLCDLESANLVFDKILTEVDSLPDVVTYTTLIDGYCRKGEFVEAKRCLNMMMKAGCSPNVVTYNAIIYALCLKGEVDEAKKMITEMTLNGVKDNTATHLNILKGLAVAGRSLEALEYFKWMAGCNMNLDAKAYIVVVKEYCKLRKIDEAIFLLKGMCERGFSHNVSCFNLMFRALIELNALDRAVLLLKQMPQMGCMPNSVSYRTVICSLCGTEGRMREVGYLVDDMLRYGIPVDATMYGCMLEGYSKTGNEDVAMQVFNEMIGKSYIISSESFSVFVKMLCAKGMIEKAELFRGHL